MYQKGIKKALIRITRTRANLARWIPLSNFGYKNSRSDQNSKLHRVLTQAAIFHHIHFLHVLPTIHSVKEQNSQINSKRLPIFYHQTIMKLSITSHETLTGVP